MNRGSLAQIIIASVFVLMFAFAIWQGVRHQMSPGAPAQTPAGATDSPQPETAALNPVDFGLPSTAREVIERRTEKSATFEISPGKFAAVSQGRPLFFKDEAGRYVPIEGSGRQEDGMLVFDRLAGGARIGLDLNKPSYTFAKGENFFTVLFEENMRTAPADDTSVTHAITGGEFLRFRVSGDRVQHEIQVEEPASFSRLRFSITTSSGLETVHKDNRLFILNPQGQPIFRFAPPGLLETDNEFSSVSVSLERQGHTYYYSADSSAPVPIRLIHQVGSDV